MTVRWFLGAAIGVVLGVGSAAYGWEAEHNIDPVFGDGSSYFTVSSNVKSVCTNEFPTLEIYCFTGAFGGMKINNSCDPDPTNRYIAAGADQLTGGDAFSDYRFRVSLKIDDDDIIHPKIGVSNHPDGYTVLQKMFLSFSRPIENGRFSKSDFSLPDILDADQLSIRYYSSAQEETETLVFRISGMAETIFDRPSACTSLIR